MAAKQRLSYRAAWRHGQGWGCAVTAPARVSCRGWRDQALLVAAAVSTVGGLASVHADVVISYAEDPNAQSSSLSNTSVCDFDLLATGTNKHPAGTAWSDVGTYKNYSIVAANQYGGAGGTGNYLVQSTSSSLGGISKTTLTLNTPSAYFGLWWSAGDASNVMEFYNGTTLVAHFTTADLLKRLPSTYNGNPNNRTQNTGEAYAFLNFFGAGTTTWDKIYFSNNGTSGFESDNHTTRVAGWSLTNDGRYPGVVFQVTNGGTTTVLGAAGAIASPVNLGNIRTNGTFATKGIALTNTAPSGSAALDATIKASSANATASGSISGLAAGGTNSSSLRAGLSSPTVAGVATGTVAVTPSSAGVELATQTVTVTGTAYNYAALGSTPQAVNVDYGKYHVGATASVGGSVSFTNTATAANVPYTDDLVVSGTGATGNLTGGATQTLAANSTGTSGSYSYALDTSVVGLRSGSMTVNYTSTPKAGVTGLDTKSVATQQITASAQVYTGQSTWTASGSGNWGGDAQLAATHANWDGLGGAPGVWSGFTTTDSATFGNAIGSTAANVTVASAVSVNSITLSNTAGSYTIAKGTAGSLSLAAAAGQSANLVDSSGLKTNSITAPITLNSSLNASVSSGGKLTVAQLVGGSGTQNLTKTGTGTLDLTGASTYTGTTSISQGTLQLDGSLASSAVTVAKGATLDGTGGSIAGSLTVSGTVAPGNGTAGNVSTLTARAETWASGGTYQVDLLKAAPVSAAQASQPVAGVDQDYLVMDSLTLEPGFTVKALPAGGSPTGFAPSLTNNLYNWIIGYTASNLSSLSGVNLDTSSFTGANTQSYHFSLIPLTHSGGGTDIVLQYNYNAVPEATTLLMGMVAVAPILLHRRRRMERVTEGGAEARP